MTTERDALYLEGCALIKRGMCLTILVYDLRRDVPVFSRNGGLIWKKTIYKTLRLNFRKDYFNITCKKVGKMAK